MYEIVINGTAYELNFGMGFVREINKTVEVPVQGVAGMKQEQGLIFAISKVLDGDLDGLCDVLLRANKGKEPRLTQKILDAYIEDDDTDIDELFKMVTGFFEKANCTRKTYQKLMEAAEKQEKENK